VAGASDYIVTGDNHLLKLGQFAGAKIIKPSDFIGLVGKQGYGR
jgi:predicted nucleic acid-binding protein